MAINDQAITGLPAGFDTRSAYQLWAYSGRLYADRTSQNLVFNVAGVENEASANNPLRLWEDLTGDLHITGTLTNAGFPIPADTTIDLVDLTSAQFDKLSNVYSNAQVIAATDTGVPTATYPFLVARLDPTVRLLQIVNGTANPVPLGSTFHIDLTLHHVRGQ